MKKLSLTPREEDIAMLSCEGFTSQEMAIKLEVSKKTIDNTKYLMLAKYQARSLTQLIAILLRNNIIK